MNTTKINIASQIIDADEWSRWTVAEGTYATDSLTSVMEHLNAYGIDDSDYDTPGENFWVYNEQDDVLYVNLFAWTGFDDEDDEAAVAAEKEYEKVLSVITELLV